MCPRHILSGRRSGTARAGLALLSPEGLTHSSTHGARPLPPGMAHEVVVEGRLLGFAGELVDIEAVLGQAQER